MSYLSFISEENGESSKGLWIPTVVCQCGNSVEGDEPKVLVEQCEQCEGNMINKKLIEFIDEKLEDAQSYAEWIWLQGIYKLEPYLDEEGNLDEVVMQGEFNEEIDIIKEWIQEFKEKENE